MFYEDRTDVSGQSVSDLRAEYASDLAAAVEAVGVEDAVERTGLDRSTVEAVGEAGGGGDLPDLSLEDAATLQALAEGTPDPDTAVEMACDHLLLGMSNAVLDVDAVAANVGLDLSPKEIQQKLERRAPMTFDEFVAIQHFVASQRQ